MKNNYIRCSQIPIVTVKSTQEGYDCIYELAQVKVNEHVLEGICWKSFPKLIFSRGDKSDAPYKDVYNRLEILTGAEYLIVPALIEIKEKYEITAVSEKWTVCRCGFAE